MSIYHLDRIFHPRSVAVVGASQREHSAGAALMRNLLKGGFKGSVYAVNPRHATVWGLACRPSIVDIGQPVDLALIATPITKVPQIIQQCVQAEVGGALILSPGGKESGTQGEQMQAEISSAAEGSPLRIIGPGSLGVACSRCKLNATLAHRMPPEGRLAFISQSGALATAIFDAAEKEHIGFSYFISLGSMGDVNFGDAIDYLGNDGRVSSIVMYIEQLYCPRRFMSAARAVSSIKPIIALKAGRTPCGALAAMRHTGADTGEDGIYEAAFKRAGILRVKTFEELFDCAELVSRQRQPQSARLVIVSNAGGPAVMAVDALADYAVEPAALMPETTARLDEILSPLWSRANPVDIRGDATPQRYLEVIDALLRDPAIDGLLVVFCPNAVNDPTETARLLIPELQSASIPVITAWLGEDAVENGRNLFNQAGIATFNSPERAIRAFMDLYQYHLNLEMHRQIPLKLPHRLSFDRSSADALIKQQLARGEPWMNETDAKRLLSYYGIPVNPTWLAANPDEAAELAATAGYPVALKVDSPGRAHRFCWDGVRLGLANEDQVRQGFADLMAHAGSYLEGDAIRGITVQRMIGPASVELALIVRTDRDFGPVMAFGWGGAVTDVADDRVLALPPINRLLARRMVEGTHVYRLLKGYRDCPPANLTLLEEVLIRLSQLVTDYSQIQEVLINPLIITNQTMSVVSARIRVQSTNLPASQHLVIAPYPNEYESRLELPEAGPLLIRPIRPEDAPLLKALFATLSSQSIYFRFFAPLRELPFEMLARFTQIDYDREIAMVAVRENAESHEEMLAVGRIIKTVDPATAEFSILVSDDWHGRGIGAALLSRCLRIAKAQGVRNIWGSVLSDNTQMLALGRKLHFSIRRGIEGGEYELKMDLHDLPDEALAR
jgi:acetyltransferase